MRQLALREWRGARRLEDAGALEDRLRPNRSRAFPCLYRREARFRRWWSDKTATMSR